MAKYVFTSKDGKITSDLENPIKDNPASQVLLDVLGRGSLPEGLKLQHAPSYKGYMIIKKGRNACGFFDTSGVLVVNGISAELKAVGVKGIIQPQSSKKYLGINVKGMDGKELKALAQNIARVLGMVKVPKKMKVKKTAKAKAEATA